VRVCSTGACAAAITKAVHGNVVRQTINSKKMRIMRGRASVALDLPANCQQTGAII